MRREYQQARFRHHTDPLPFLGVAVTSSSIASSSSSCFPSCDSRGTIGHLQLSLERSGSLATTDVAFVDVARNEHCCLGDTPKRRKNIPPREKERHKSKNRREQTKTPTKQTSNTLTHSRRYEKEDHDRSHNNETATHILAFVCCQCWHRVRRAAMHCRSLYRSILICSFPVSSSGVHCRNEPSNADKSLNSDAKNTFFRWPSRCVQSS